MNHATRVYLGLVVNVVLGLLILGFLGPYLVSSDSTLKVLLGVVVSLLYLPFPFVWFYRRVCEIRNSLNS